MVAGSVANVLCNLPRPHPLRRGPATSYDLCVLFGLPVIVGSAVGTLLNKVCVWGGALSYVRRWSCSQQSLLRSHAHK
jgi:hypothetical protein